MLAGPLKDNVLARDLVNKRFIFSGCYRPTAEALDGPKVGDKGENSVI